MSLAARGHDSPARRRARICATDGAVLALTQALLDLGAGGGLWHVVNITHGLQLEQPGSTVVSVPKLLPVADTLRGYLGDSDLWPDMRAELASVADFLTAAHERGAAVKFVM